MKKILFLMLILISFVDVGINAQSKSTESATNLVSESQTELSYTNIDEYFANNLISFSKLLKYDNFRKRLKELSLKQFDGDYDVLFSSIKDVELSKGLTVERFLLDLDNEEISFLISIKNLQFSVPILCENWDLNYIPNLTYAPNDKDDKESFTMKSINNNGKVENLYSDKEPQNTVVIIGISERVDSDGITNIFGKSIISRPPPPPPPPSSRKNGNIEKMKEIRCDNLKAIEPWYLGKPEIYWVISAINYNTPVNPNIPLVFTNAFELYIGNHSDTRKNINNKFSNVDKNMFVWYVDTSNQTNTVYSSIMSYYWYEFDGGHNPVKIQFSFKPKINIPIVGTVETGVSVEFTIQDRDDPCGKVTVNYQDPLSMVYSTGLISFKLDNVKP